VCLPGQLEHADRVLQLDLRSFEEILRAMLDENDPTKGCQRKKNQPEKASQKTHLWKLDFVD
jgi:hypothetical protein